MNKNWGGCRGFTALELLVLVGTVAVISLVTIASIIRGSEGSRRIQCLRNLKEMSQASLMYAENDSQNRLVGFSTLPAGSSDDLTWLYGFGTNYPAGLITDLKTFVCPSTKNRVRTNSVSVSGAPKPAYVLIDLLNNAANTSAPAGHSYEVSAVHLRTNARKTSRSVLGYVNQTPPFAGVIPGPSRSFLFYDAMDANAAIPGTVNDYPSAGNNHGAEGGNVGFADGHAEWVGVGDWLDKYNLSYDTNRQL